jgi:hypothetical protein
MSLDRFVIFDIIFLGWSRDPGPSAAGKFPAIFIFLNEKREEKSSLI